jgi:hypothetical protein
MSHRIKNKHKSRHRSHAIKPANLPKPQLPPVVIDAPVRTPDSQAPTEAGVLSQPSPSLL